MTKRFISVIIPILAVASVFPQQKDRLSFEAGTTLSKSVFHRSQIQPGAFFKTSYTGRTFAKNQWRLYIPFGLGYYYYSEKVYPGNADPRLYSYTLKHSHYHDVNAHLGLQLAYEESKICLGAGLFLNAQMTFYSKTRTVDAFSNEENFRYDYGHRGIYPGAAVFVLYQVGSRAWLGPCFESYLYAQMWCNNPGLKLQIDLH